MMRKMKNNHSYILSNIAMFIKLLSLYKLENVLLLRRVVYFSISEHLPFRIAMQGMIKGIKDSYFLKVLYNYLIISKYSDQAGLVIFA